MRFFKDNSYDIVRLYINQIGISIFSLVLYTAVGMIENDALVSGFNIGLSIFAMLFYFVLLYTATWEYGAKDKIRIDAGRLEPQKNKGLFMALFANAPNFFIAGLCALFAVIYRFAPVDFLGILAVLLNTFMRITMAMYLGVLQAVFGSFTTAADWNFIFQAIGFFIVPVLAIASTHIGYLFGSRDFKILSVFSSKKK